MRVRWLLALVTCVVAGVQASGAPVRGEANGLTVEVTSDPPVITVGRAVLRMHITRDRQPLRGAVVRVLVRMADMDMGEREQFAKPVEGSPGDYTAPAVFAMVGQYNADVRVAGPGGEALVRLKLATGLDTSRQKSDRTLLYRVLGACTFLLLVLYTLLRMRRTGQRIRAGSLLQRHVIGGVLLLGAAAAVSVYAVRHWRRPGAMTPIEAQAMEMETPPPPGVSAVRLTSVAMGPVEETVTYTGQAAGWVEQDVYPRVSGWIVEMPVYLGTRVRKGQLLATLDTSQIRPLVSERSAAVDAARLTVAVMKAEEQQAIAAHVQASAQERARAAHEEAAQSEAHALEAEAEEAGQTLSAARLELEAVEAALKSAQADHRYWSGELKRMEALLARGAVSVDEFEMTRARFTSADAALQEAGVRLRQAEVSVRSAEARLRRALASVENARGKARAASEEANAARAALQTAAAFRAAARYRLSATLSNLRSAAAMLDDARTRVAYAEIRATADGVVTQRLVAPGVLAAPGQAILRMAQDRPIRLQASVSETDLVRIRVGTMVRAWRSGHPESPVEARVTSVAPNVDRETRTGVVEAMWPNRGGEFAVGESVVMQIVVASVSNVIRVPVKAAREFTPASGAVEGRLTRYAVWVAEESGDGSYTAKRVVIEPGLIGDRYIEARRGLAVGARVVAEGGDYLHEGGQLAPTEEPGAVYVCPMHPDVRRQSPGKCPRCGMALVRQEAGK